LPPQNLEEIDPMFRARIRKTLARSVLAGSLALAGAANAPAQTNLSAGDVALIGWVDNGSPNDVYALVALADLPAGTILYFTDNGWDNRLRGLPETRTARTTGTATRRSRCSP
jgi:hypothetical protein